jgi:hypothetical protein
MPVWICPVVGTGVAKSVPGAVLVALAAIEPPGVLPRWQVSQVVDDGMCELVPAGEVGGITTMRLMPTKLEPLTDGPWQAAQLFVMPLWFISEPLNFAPLTTGVAAMLEPAPTWQASHEAVVGTWLPGRPTMLKFADGIAKPAAAAALWHCAQLVLVLCALAWIAVIVGITEKSLVVWHEVHCAVAEYGM